jgi:hypothetical protein
MSSADTFVLYTSFKNDIVVNRSTHIVNYTSTKLFLDALMQAKLPENIEYSIYNAAGQMQLKGNLVDQKADLTSLPRGIYTIRLKGITASKMIVKN